MAWKWRWSLAWIQGITGGLWKAGAVGETHTGNLGELGATWRRRLAPHPSLLESGTEPHFHRVGILCRLIISKVIKMSRRRDSKKIKWSLTLDQNKVVKVGPLQWVLYSIKMQICEIFESSTREMYFISTIPPGSQVRWIIQHFILKSPSGIGDISGRNWRERAWGLSEGGFIYLF